MACSCPFPTIQEGGQRMPGEAGELAPGGSLEPVLHLLPPLPPRRSRSSPPPNLTPPGLPGSRRTRPPLTSLPPPPAVPTPRRWAGRKAGSRGDRLRLCSVARHSAGFWLLRPFLGVNIGRPIGCWGVLPEPQRWHCHSKRLRWIWPLRLVVCCRWLSSKMMKWGLSSGTPADSYYEVRSDCTDDVPKSKFKIKVWFLSPFIRLFFCSLSANLNYCCVTTQH